MTPPDGQLRGAVTPAASVNAAEQEDGTLLRRYADEHSEAAFAELVRRRIDLVFSAALRRCRGNRHQAEEVVQAVFTRLAQNAAQLAGHPALGAWLYVATRNAATNLAMADHRRVRREHAAMTNEDRPVADATADWGEVRRVLDDAMDELGQADRTAVVLRFFERRSFCEIGAALNATENTARMRTDRALEKLRTLLSKRGVNSTAVALGVVLTHRAVSFAPSELAGTVSNVAVKTVAQSVAVGGIRGRSVVKGALAVTTAVIVVLAVKMGVAPNLDVAPDFTAAPQTAATAGNEETSPGLTPATAAATGGGPGTAAPPSRITIAQAARQQDGEMTAERILEKMAGAYAALISYSDDGEVVVRDTDGRNARIRIVGFETHFVRPDRFRLVFAQMINGNPARTSKIRSDGQQVVYFAGGTIAPRPSSNLAVAISSYTISSYGSSYHVPRLLLGTGTASMYVPVSTLESPERLADADVDGVICYVVRGRHLRGNDYELSIAQEDYLLRKIATTTPLPLPIRTRTVTPVAPRVVTATLEEFHRNIRINEPIPSDVFQIEP